MLTFTNSAVVRAQINLLWLLTDAVCVTITGASKFSKAAAFFAFAQMC
jgi:hypothetical protein